MTLTTTGLNGTDCLPQYGISDDMVCTGRVSGLDITDNGSTITIAGGSAYVKVTDVSGFEFNVKVYLDTAETLTKANNSDIIIFVPLANVQNSQNNTNFSNIATLGILPNGTGGDFHLVLATVDGSGNVSELANAGHYLPGCDFCMRCEAGVLQLPNVKAGNIQADDIIADDLFADQVTANNFIGDGSGLTNVPLTASYMTETTAGLGEIATRSEVQSLSGDRVLTTGNISDLLEFSPNWALIDRVIETQFTGTVGVYEQLVGFDIKVPGTYRIAFIANEGRSFVNINGVQTNGTNVGGTASIFGGGEIVNFNNTRYFNSLSSTTVAEAIESEYLFSKSITGGSENDVYYGDFTVTEAMLPAVISIENDGVGGNSGISRAEILGTPFFYPINI